MDHNDRVLKFAKYLCGNHHLDLAQMSEYLAELLRAKIFCQNENGEWQIYNGNSHLTDRITFASIESLIKVHSKRVIKKELTLSDSIYNLMGYSVSVGDRGETKQRLVLTVIDDDLTSDIETILFLAKAYLQLILDQRLKTKSSEDLQRQEQVKQALSALSYTEARALAVILNELQSNIGTIITSKIVMAEGIAKSIGINALRKVESAGLLETQSRGGKGTYIMILNPYLRDALKSYL